MKKQTTFSPEREREIHAYRREAQERLSNRTTFDPCLGLYWPAGSELGKMY